MSDERATPESEYGVRAVSVPYETWDRVFLTLGPQERFVNEKLLADYPHHLLFFGVFPKVALCLWSAD